MQYNKDNLLLFEKTIKNYDNQVHLVWNKNEQST